jgi:hypothetical protein
VGVSIVLPRALLPYARGAGTLEIDAPCPTVRDALAVDSHQPAGVYFGTRSGKLYASHSAGDHWKAIAESLPSICCVKTAVVGAV